MISHLRDKWEQIHLQIQITQMYKSGDLSGKTITIDPGHGGSDTGAIGPNGYTEKEATLPFHKI